METPDTFDPIWEEIYGQGRMLNRYPWDSVVSFLFRHAPRERKRSEVRVLEVGCGAGSNLWFAAREGFHIAGIDGSASAIEFARQRLTQEGLNGDLRVGDFTKLPFPSASIDLAIDRGALVCCGFSAAQAAIAEIHRVLAPGGKFFFNPYGDRHSSCLGSQPGPDGLRREVTAGSLTGVGQLCFYGRRDIEAALSSDWRVLSMHRVERWDESNPEYSLHEEWQVIAEKL